MVPHVTYKRMTVPFIVYKPEVRQKTITIYRNIPETRTIRRMVSVMAPEERIRRESYSICNLKYEELSEDVTVMVPHTEIREGVRITSRPVMVQETRTICRDAGRWVSRTHLDDDGCRRSCRVWVPEVIREEIVVTVCKTQLVEEPYTYEVVVCRPEIRTITRRVCKPVYETQTRDVPYTVYVPKQIEQEFTETACKTVAEERTVNCMSVVATSEQREILVPIATLTPKEVTYAANKDCWHCR